MEKEKKQDIISEYGHSNRDTGSTEVQVALLTERINQLTYGNKELSKELKEEIRIRDGRIQILKRENGKVTYRNVYVPPEGSIIIQKKDYERLHFQVSRDLGRELYAETLQLIEFIKTSMSARWKEISKLDMPV